MMHVVSLYYDVYCTYVLNVVHVTMNLAHVIFTINSYCSTVPFS